MTIELSKSFVHNPCNKKGRKYSDKELTQIMLRLMEKSGINTGNIEVTRDNGLLINSLPDLKLHTVMLEAEKLGLSMKYTKKTLIEVC